jgi:hypothetical protein
MLSRYASSVSPHHRDMDMAKQKKEEETVKKPKEEINSTSNHSIAYHAYYPYFSHLSDKSSRKPSQCLLDGGDTTC